MAANVQLFTMSEPLAGARNARFDICPGSGNLSIDGLAGASELASGALEYLASQGEPSRALVFENGLAALTLRGASGRQAWINLPWAACNGATSWQLHLNPKLPADIKAFSDGGNIEMDLFETAVRRVTAETGGGSIRLSLPAAAADLFACAQSGAGSVEVEIGAGLKGSCILTLSSGAGNVSVRIPDGLPARIHASCSLGKVQIDPLYAKINGITYQTPGFESSRDRVEITLKSGLGSVIASSK